MRRTIPIPSAVAGILIACLTGCGGGKSSPTAPTPTPTPTATRVITLSGNLAFGSVPVGATADATFRISNSGTGALTVTSIAGPGGYTLNWTSGAVAAGGSQDVTVRFAPAAAQIYSGTLTVNADQTSGTNTIAVSGTGTGPGGSGVPIAGRAFDVFTSAGLAGIAIRLPDGSGVTTAADGTFSLAAASGQYTADLLGPGAVERQTTLRFPGADAKLSLIPSSFDLGTFDQMCRGGAATLRRWDTAPRLVIIDAVLQFTTVGDTSYVATADRLTTDDRDAIIADLAWGLPQVTGETFGAFNSVTTESPTEGARVSFFTREGAIVVARFKGLTTATTYWGYGRWASRSSVVVAGAVMLDRDFDGSGSIYKRTLRVHEMGHALGWDHVTMRPSFMNNSAIVEPNAFDKDATRLAFLRPPGNQSPDRDPSSFSANFRSFPMIWGPITP